MGSMTITQWSRRLPVLVPETNPDIAVMIIVHPDCSFTTIGNLPQQKKLEQLIAQQLEATLNREARAVECPIPKAFTSNYSGHSSCIRFVSVNFIPCEACQMGRMSTFSELLISSMTGKSIPSIHGTLVKFPLGELFKGVPR